MCHAVAVESGTPANHPVHALVGSAAEAGTGLAAETGAGFASEAGLIRAEAGFVGFATGTVTAEVRSVAVTMGAAAACTCCFSWSQFTTCF